MAEKQYRKGDVIFREGDEGDSFFQIEAGKVEVISNYGKENEVKLTELTAGEIFGEMAVLEGTRRSATIVAAEDVTVKEIFPKELDSYLAEQPEKIIRIMQQISGRIRELTNDYTEVTAALNAGTAVKNDSLFEKIKKFLSGLNAPKQTFEETQSADHSQGFSMKVDNLSKGTIVFKEGDPSGCMYDIHFGRVGIYKGYGTPEEKLLTDLYRNNFFGEMGMIDGEPRSATAVVLEDNTTLETIRPEDLAELMTKNPMKVDMIMQFLSRRLRKLTVDYTDACQKLYKAYTD